ncbi:MAG TPA: discoidin domain-containing protein, partial [Planctomycetota bacterium]|nr:discoidin domain-containing protein [Planctomycetota bacterium]
MRKKILGSHPEQRGRFEDALDLAEIATVLVTSEDAAHPIEHAFDSECGPGASRWVAGEPGDQWVVLEFDAPQDLRRIVLEIEEREVERTQELALSVSKDSGRTYQEIVRQEFTFSPRGATFEREDWTLAVDGVGRLRVWIRP